EDMTFDEDMTVVKAPTGAKTEYEWNDDVLTIEIKFDKRSAADALGKIFLMGEENSGAYTVKISGNIIYDVNLDKNPNFSVEEDIPVIGGVTEVSFPVTVASSESSSKKDSVSTIEYGNYTAPGTTPVAPPIENPDTGEKFEFDDISDVDWATESINALLEKGIISKSDDKKFNPNNEITRAEYLKLVVEALGMADETAESDLNDVSKEDWFYKYVASAQSAEIVFGNELGEFNPNESITREDMAVIVIRAMEKAGIEIKAAPDEKFSDDDSMSDYAKAAIYSLKGMGIINGVGDNRFNPLGNATRAETAKMIYELIKAVR
ncbi:MAG: S-layer homology domain-containing protein, partial [Clostridia bacterium]|nr:S-layer homology domain-containing protein [Clostridia bacterium]